MWKKYLLDMEPTMRLILCDYLTHAKHFIDSMREFGVSIYLDDFGAGFSSFAYLKDLNANYLKIDGLFVKDLATNPKNLSIVKSMIGIAQMNGMKTVAEYVATEEIYDIVKSLDIDFAQGYAIDEPHPWGAQDT
jgi:EAL domain-containing protein (putative c-di-GMP-specific phosphodiesterase class I)